MSDFDRRLNDHREQADRLDGQLSAFVERLPYARAVRQSIVGIETRMSGIESRLDGLEQKFQSIESISGHILERLTAPK